MNRTKEVDYLIIGGGFYGCCLALFLRSVSARIALVERSDSLLGRASRVNQARVHSGFHYPRSALTAVKSLMLHRRFAADFPDAIVDDFSMIYAIAKRRSLVSANRFYRMFTKMDAPITPANGTQSALFSSDMIEAAFACHEIAFSYPRLREHLMSRLDERAIDLNLGSEVVSLSIEENAVNAHLSDGSEIRARYVFNVTYSQINQVRREAELPPASLKHELTELALIEPPEELRRIGITVMDGPFFSTMPYPSEALYSLSHVRYTPHRGWIDGVTSLSPYSVLEQTRPQSHARHMIADSARYLPCLTQAEWKKSLYEVKTVLTKNESNDGRPILYRRRPAGSRVISILGSKIDNIYDLFDLIRSSEPEWATANTQHLFGRAG